MDEIAPIHRHVWVRTTVDGETHLCSFPGCKAMTTLSDLASGKSPKLSSDTPSAPQPDMEKGYQAKAPEPGQVKTEPPKGGSNVQKKPGKLDHIGPDTIPSADFADQLVEVAKRVEKKLSEDRGKIILCGDHTIAAIVSSYAKYRIEELKLPI